MLHQMIAERDAGYGFDQYGHPITRVDPLEIAPLAFGLYDFLTKICGRVCAPVDVIAGLRRFVFRIEGEDPVYYIVCLRSRTLMGERELVTQKLAHYTIRHEGQQICLAKIFRENIEAFPPVRCCLRVDSPFNPATPPYDQQEPVNLYRGNVLDRRRNLAAEADLLPTPVRAIPRVKQCDTPGFVVGVATSHIRESWCAGSTDAYDKLLDALSRMMFEPGTHGLAVVVHQRWPDWQSEQLASVLAAMSRGGGETWKWSYEIDDGVQKRHTGFNPVLNLHYTGPRRIADDFGPGGTWLRIGRAPQVTLVSSVYDKPRVRLDNFANFLALAQCARDLPELDPDVMVFEASPCFAGDDRHHDDLMSVVRHDNSHKILAQFLRDRWAIRRAAVLGLTGQ